MKIIFKSLLTTQLIPQIDVKWIPNGILMVVTQRLIRKLDLLLATMRATFPQQLCCVVAVVPKSTLNVSLRP